MKILYVTSEAAPFCKTGGLADVLGSLPPAVAAAGDEVAVIMPLHGKVSQQWREKMTDRGFVYVDLGWRHQYCGLFSIQYENVTWYFIDNEYYYRRPNLYGDFDDGERYAFFSKAVIDLLPSMDWLPDVIHCNDWQSALVPVYLKEAANHWDAVRNIKTVFTIHNIEYQGQYSDYVVENTFGLDYGWYSEGTLQMDGCVNLLKGAMMICDEITTVSPTYAQQLHDPFYAHGLHEVVNSISYKMSGVLNGIDIKSYDPSADKALPKTYTPDDMEGKKDCKADLQVSLGLREDPNVPIIAMVTRLVGHKGVDLVCKVFDDIIHSGAQFVVLGTGDPGYEDFFRAQCSRHVGAVAAQITYSESLAHRIYAGADIFLMPSKSEPCGLSQMIAMRYGTLPVVRKTGGLADSVKSCQVGQEDGTGFLFESYYEQDMLAVIRQAISLYHEDPEGFKHIQYRGMTDDFSWTASAKKYQEIYMKIVG